MNVRQTPFATAAPFETEASVACDATRGVEFIAGSNMQGECLHLRPQQRVRLPPAGTVIVLREGMLAVDAMPASGKLQVLDFLSSGDIISTSTVLPAPGSTLRAITTASLVSLDPPAIGSAASADEYWMFLASQCCNQLARVNIHQLMIGRLETEARVASFILGLALRSARNDTRGICVALPMSRTDIANYLVINCDTLSRTMMKFCDRGLIERESRHAIRVVDLDALKKRSPIASLMSEVFERSSLRNDFVGRAPPINTSLRSIPREQGVNSAREPVVSASCGSMGRFYAARTN